VFTEDKLSYRQIDYLRGKFYDIGVPDDCKIVVKKKTEADGAK
jgi:hypothetical protein